MPRRYLFLCPDRRTASGGIAVIYDTVVTLRAAGYDALVVHSSPDAGYPDYPGAPPMAWTLDWRRERIRHMGVRAGLREWGNIAGAVLRGGAVARLVLRAGDVIVTPEYMLAESLRAFPHNEIGVFVQNPFSFANAWDTAQARGLEMRLKWSIAVSEVCHDQIDLLGLPPAFHLPVSMKPEDFAGDAVKEDLITYMPRKRPAEARRIVAALRARGRVEGYRIEALDNMPRAEIAEKLRRSRFFISLQKEESIGFPAAEAMAAGCIVVGYTGLGGREYFTTETGIPVTEDDTLGLVRALEAAVQAHAHDPARFDAMREHARDEINRRYGRAAFEADLLQIWQAIDAGRTSP